MSFIKKALLTLFCIITLIFIIILIINYYIKSFLTSLNERAPKVIDDMLSSEHANIMNSSGRKLTEKEVNELRKEWRNIHSLNK